MSTKIKVWRDVTTKGLENAVNAWLDENKDIKALNWMQTQSSMGDKVPKTIVTLTLVYASGGE